MPRKTIIEVALPMDAINQASYREKPIRKGHPSSLGVRLPRWPLAVPRTATFAQVMEDPSEYVNVRKPESLLKARWQLWEELGRAEVPR